MSIEEKLLACRRFTIMMSACYEWMHLQTGGQIFNAADTTRAALCLYIVQTGARTGWRVTGDMLGVGNLRALVQPLAKLRLMEVERRGALATAYFVVNDEGVVGEDNPAGDIFPSVNAADKLGALTWVCRAERPGASIEIDLWTETIPKEGNYDAIELQQRAVRRVLAPLGYTTYIRVE